MIRALLVFVLGFLGISCMNREPEKIFVPVPCVGLELPPQPALPIQGYQPTWTSEQLLDAYARSTLLLEQWRRECVALVEAHNRNQQKPRAPTGAAK